METVRWFSSEVEAYASEWRAEVVDSRAWTEVEPDPSFGGLGEAQGFFVNCGSLDGYAKQSGDVCRAAHEKIASDLAYDLRLPVPPVVLTEPDARRCSVSSIPFSAPQKWEHVSSLPDIVTSMRERVSKAAAAMTVFDTWLDNRDRVGHGGNVIASTALADGPGIAYIDYAYSLSHGWGENDAPPVNEKRGPFPDLGPRHDDIIRDTVDAIRALSDEHIWDVINRIPAEFLPSPRREKMAKGLISRRDALRPFFCAQGGDLQ